MPRWGGFFGLLLGLVAAGRLAAQDVDVRRAQATRPELEAALDELDQVVASSGYSKAYRKSRAAEATMVRQRLSEGDFQAGDQVALQVTGEQGLTGTFPVLPDRTLSLPGLPPISLQGVLRSEIAAHLTAEVGRYVKDPQVVVQGSYIRLAILGSVGKPGYYSLPADQLLTDAIMTAGGPSASPDMDKSSVRRGGREVISGQELQLAIENGESLDQLNLHGGDELVVGGKHQGQNIGGRSGGLRNWLWPVQLALSLTLLATRIF